MNVPAIFHFLKDISANNNREWFIEHKKEYEVAQKAFENLLSQIIARISLFDEQIKGVTPKDCTFRIYRDVRFAADKSPYKTHIGGYINAKGKKSDHFGYYIHLEPGNCLLAGGSLCLPTPVLRAVRESIYDNIEKFLSIVEDPNFKKFFPQIGEDPLKSAPKGFSKEFKYIDYLKFRQYTPICRIPDSFFLESDWLDQTETIFKQLKRFGDFINFTIDNLE